MTRRKLPASRNTRPEAPPEYPTGIPAIICQEFERSALQLADAGVKRYSTQGILEKLRWETAVEQGSREFKVNNNWRAELARWFMQRHPKLPGFFETRRMRRKRNA